MQPDALAADLVGSFGRYLEDAAKTSGQEDRRGLAKHLVIITSVLRSAGSLDTATALRLTVRAYGEHFCSPASTLKKCASEARALLLARDERCVAEVRADSLLEAFAEVDGQLALESAHAAAAQRAARLSGRRGGRPRRDAKCPRGREPSVGPERLARAIVSLKERARAGDESAQVTLRKLNLLIAQ